MEYDCVWNETRINDPYQFDFYQSQKQLHAKAVKSFGKDSLAPHLDLVPQRVDRMMPVVAVAVEEKIVDGKDPRCLPPDLSWLNADTVLK